jgi:chaperonin GroEL
MEATMLVKEKQIPKVVFQPEVYLGMQRGINRLANAIRPTLGPFPRLVAVESTQNRKRKPELLDNGGLIARRIIQLPDPDEDAGAMLLRHMLWELHEQAGDGTATAAVIFQEVYNQGIRFIAAGGDALRLRVALEQGAQLIIAELEKMKVFIHGREKLTCLAESLCYDPDLAAVLGEIYAELGMFGSLDIRTGNGRQLEREYFKGMYWQGGLGSRLMATDVEHGSARLDQTAIVLSNLEIDEPEELVPLLDLLIRNGDRSLLFVARRLSERALGLLVSPQVRKKLQVLFVKIPGLTIDDQWAALQDLSVLTGACPLLREAGDQIGSIRAGHLGRASQVYADMDQFGMIEQQWHPHRLQQHMESLKKAFAAAEDKQVRRKLVERIGKLQGGSAVLWIGGPTLQAIESRKASAERASEAMRSAIRGGVVPGGGAAYLDCCQALSARIHDPCGSEESAAYRILTRALREPMRTLLANAGYPHASASEGLLMAEIELTGRGSGFDMTNKRVVNMLEAGIYDSAPVAKAVISCAVRGAALALTTQVLVHRSHPPDASALT